MRKEDIAYYAGEKMLRPHSIDISVVKTLLESSQEKSKAAKLLPAEEFTATLIFLGIYESIRQLGDAMWRLIGYESLSHDLSMKILLDANVKEKTKLQNLDRFRRIRNDSNYRGQKITLTEAREILDFWEKCSEEIITEIKKRMQKNYA